MCVLGYEYDIISMYTGVIITTLMTLNPDTKVKTGRPETHTPQGVQ